MILIQLAGYVKNILFFMIFTTFVGIIIPDGKYKKYIDMVTGLILILIIAKPVSSILSGGQLPVDKLFSGIEGYSDSSIHTREHDSVQYEMLKKTYDNLAVKQMQSLLDKDGKYQIISAEIETSEDMGQIKSISLLLQAVEAQQAGIPLIRIERIEPVRIGSGAGDSDKASGAEEPEIKNTKKVISDFYNLSPDNIHITVRATCLTDK